MKLAIITLTKEGILIGKRVVEAFPEAVIYGQERHLQEGVKKIEPSLDVLLEEVFYEYDSLVFIMAAGIVVRKLAPLIRHKAADPAVLVMDEKGEFVISLLSGHIGGANELAVKIADHLGARPVITTASDVKETMAVDMIAKALNCSIEDLLDAKKITVQIIENRNVGILSEIPVELPLKENFILLQGGAKEEKIREEELDGLIIIAREKPKEIYLPYAWLIPRDLVIGIGCKRGKTKEELCTEFFAILEEMDLSLLRVEKMVSVEIKEDEVGLLELSKTLKIPLQFLSVESIREVEDRFEGSAFVNKTLGIKAVSEPCGYIGSDHGKCLVPVQRRNGITLSIWQKV